jgi:hypothetical protein
MLTIVDMLELWVSSGVGWQCAWYELLEVRV